MKGPVFLGPTPYSAALDFDGSGSVDAADFFVVPESVFAGRHLGLSAAIDMATLYQIRVRVICHRQQVWTQAAESNGLG